MKKVVTSLLACLSAGALMATTLVISMSAGAQGPSVSAKENSIRLDFDESLYTAVVEKAEGNTAAEDVVERKDGVCHILATNGAGLFSKVLNQTAFAADEDVEITFDYKGTNRSWSDDKICIGAKDGNAQWGSVVLQLPNIAEGKATVLYMSELYQELASAGSAPLEANTLYRFRIVVTKASGRLDVYITKNGETESAEPLLTVTDEKIKTLNGGLAFKAWATEYQVDNLKIIAGGKTLVNDGFSDFDLTHEKSEEGAYAVMENGKLKVYGWNANGDGKTVVSTGLTGRTDLSSFTMTMEYTPTDTSWNVDTVLLGYKNDGTKQNCLNLTFEGTGNAKKVKLDWNDGSKYVALDDAELALVSGTTYGVQVTVNAVTGTVSAIITPDGGAAISLSAENNDAIKTLAGDVGVTSWAGNYTVDNIVVTPEKPDVVTESTTESTAESTTESTAESTTESTTKSGAESTTGSVTESTTTTQKPVTVSTVTLDFDDSLRAAVVGKDPNPNFASETEIVEMANGVFHLVATNGPGVYSQVLNSTDFTADENVEITFDYTGIDRAWSDDRIVIGAKGDVQWGGIVLRLANTAAGTVTVTCVKEDMATVLGTGGSAPLEANVLYHFRIVLNKAVGKMDVYITKNGKAVSAAPTLSVTDESIKVLSGGVAFGGWATEYTVDNLKIVAGDKLLLNADFSTMPQNLGHPDNPEAGTVTVIGGVLKLNGWNPAHSGGSVAITKGLLGMNDLADFDLSLEYTPADVQWSVDKLLLGYKNNATEQDTLILEFLGNEQKVVLKKNVSGTVTELASSALILHKNSTYGINVSVDTNAGKVTVSINSVNGTPVELSVTDDFVKTLKGDIGFSSWGGEYAVDNVKVTAYGIELPGTSTTTPSGVPETPDTGDTMPVAAMAVLAVAAMVIPAVKVKRGAK